MWSLGALLELDDRAKMENFIKTKAPSLEIPPVKDDETIFEYMVIFLITFSFKSDLGSNTIFYFHVSVL